MNLIEIRKQANMNRAISLIISILLVFSLFMAGTIQVEAIAPLVIYGGAAVAAALLVAMGYSALTTGDVTAAWDSMSQSLKDGLSVAGQHFRRSAENFAVARGVISAVVYGQFLDWFNLNASDGYLGAEGYDFDYVKSIYQFPAVPNVYQHDLVEQAFLEIDTVTYPYNLVIFDYEDLGLIGDESAEYIDGNGNYVRLYQSTAPFYLNKYGSEAFSFYSSQASSYDYWYRNNLTGNLVHQQPADKGAGAILEAVGDTGIGRDNRYYYSNFPVTYYEGTGESGNILGYMYFGNLPVDYIYNNVYNPADNPLPVDSAGNREVQIPYTDAPDTNVAIPENNSIDNPITLQTVIDGYGSMQDFFDAGGRIELADGTVIYGGSAVNDLTRSGSDVLPDTGTGAIESDVSGIKSLVNKLLGVITGIASAISAGFSSLISALSNPFDWSNKSPSGPGFISGLWAFFAVLLALLVAIMGLIAKVVIFIGQLYTIPASSAMLHPTMIQGLEWARGFNSQTGVNLYGLITGVISIVLGVVCFKLLRKIITGIGTSH